PTAPGFQAGDSPSPASGNFQRLFDETAVTTTATPEGSRLDAPKVDVIEENGRVASIVVTCRCCERIELACRY
ncbi:MAG: hypothetical protein ABMA01_13120, partial [Chthoniobacteraceae bacterium]